MVHDCYFDTDFWFRKRLPFPLNVVYKTSDKTMALSLVEDFPEHPNYFEALDKTKPFKRFNWKTRKLEDSWALGEVDVSTLANYLT